MAIFRFLPHPQSLVEPTVYAVWASTVLNGKPLWVYFFLACFSLQDDFMWNMMFYYYIEFCIVCVCACDTRCWLKYHPGKLNCKLKTSGLILKRGDRLRTTNLDRTKRGRVKDIFSPFVASTWIRSNKFSITFSSKTAESSTMNRDRTQQREVEKNCNNNNGSQAIPIFLNKHDLWFIWI